MFQYKSVRTCKTPRYSWIKLMSEICIITLMMIIALLFVVANYPTRSLAPCKCLAEYGELLDLVAAVLSSTLPSSFFPLLQAMLCFLCDLASKQLKFRTS